MAEISHISIHNSKVEPLKRGHAHLGTAKKRGHHFNYNSCESEIHHFQHVSYMFVNDKELIRRYVCVHVSEMMTLISRKGKTLTSVDLHQTRN